jgi:hypothetical protein
MGNCLANGVTKHPQPHNYFQQIVEATLLTHNNIIIKRLCYQPYPCRHYVSDDDGKSWKILNAREIVTLLRDNGINIPEHFQRTKCL